MTSPRPFRIELNSSDIDDLKTRLRATRFPPEEPFELEQAWAMGVPLRVGKEWTQKWLDFDFAKMQRELDSVDGFVVDLVRNGMELDGCAMRGPHEGKRV